MSWTRSIVIAAALGLLMLAAWQLPLSEWTTTLAARARETGPLGVALFFAAYVLSTVAVLPASILTLAAGFAYGPVWGLAIVSPASVMGATCAFLLGRTLLRGWAERTVGASPRMRALDAAIGREGFKVVMLLRLSPVFPFSVLNYALSLTRVRTVDYVVASFIGMLPATALFVYFGSLVPTAAALASSEPSGGSARTALYAAGLAATVAVVAVTARAARRALEAEMKGTEA